MGLVGAGAASGFYGSAGRLNAPDPPNKHIDSKRRAYFFGGIELAVSDSTDIHFSLSYKYIIKAGNLPHKSLLLQVK